MSQPTTRSTLGPDGVPGGEQRRGFLTVLILAWFGGTLVLGTLGAAAMPKVLAFHHADTKDSAIALIAWENTWLIRARNAIAGNGGTLIAFERIPAADVMAVLESADA